MKFNFKCIAVSIIFTVLISFFGITCAKKPLPVQNSGYVKWMEFNLTEKAMKKAMQIDISSKDDDYPINWIDIISYAACKNGNNFNRDKLTSMDSFANQIKEGFTVEEITKDMKYFSYYKETYTAVLEEFLGDYSITSPDGHTTIKYGIKAFSPIAEGYSFSHYNDFGAKRSYGFKRKHLGNDLLGSIGTPIVAIESGTVEALGWNRYGGWRIGIRSFDKKRYYYYAHLKKDNPYAKNLKEGDVVNAGDYIGYLGMTGYSTRENVNNINIPHLHFGMQIIFDEAQKEGNNEIWIDVYEIINFLNNSKSTLIKDNDVLKRKYIFKDIENSGD